MKYPRVLVVALGRINAADTTNNGLLLRNLFGAWPKENLAQIYSSGDNGDAGYFGHYYQLGPKDRRFGKLFYKLKAEELKKSANSSQSAINSKSFDECMRLLERRLVFDTGLYELIFRPRLSEEMLAFVDNFKPEIIFGQGYNLTFAWLPPLLKKAAGAKLAFLCSDDWPTYLYSGQLGEPTLFRWLMRPIVEATTRQLFSEVDVPFAFGEPMAEEYAKRYKKNFITLSHSDDPRRFEEAMPYRCHQGDIFSILALGTFNQFRWPLLLDMNECCRLLNAQGIKARVAVLSSAIDPAGKSELKHAEHIDIFEDPGNHQLPAYLKGANLLFLAEGFAEGFVSAIRFSVSSKAHLFMFSQRPTLVYGHSDTGIIKYAEAYQWAYTVRHRDVQELFKTVCAVLHNKKENEKIINNATKTAHAFHTTATTQSKFLAALMGCTDDRG